MVRPSLNSTHVTSASNRADFALTKELIAEFYASIH